MKFCSRLYIGRTGWGGGLGKERGGRKAREFVIQAELEEGQYFGKVP